MTMYRLTLPFAPWNILPKPVWLLYPTNPTFLCFANWRQSWKATIDIIVVEAESQAMLNTLTEHAFWDAFKERQKHWCSCAEGNYEYFQGDGGQ
jgi:hypothetical protein